MADNVWNNLLELGPASLPGLRQRYTGNVYFVGTTDTTAGILGSSYNPGSVPNRPFSTMTQAAAAVVAGRGDVVYVLPNYTETITATTGLAALAKAKTAVIGLGNGTQKPVFTFATNATANVPMSAAGCLLENVKLVCNVGSLVAAVTVSGANCTVQDCDFVQGTGSNHALSAITSTAAANGLTISGCTIYGLTTGTAGAVMVANATAINIVGGDKVTIKNNRISGRFTATTLGCIQILTTASTNMLITGNSIENWTTSSQLAICDTVTGSTGFIDGNRYVIQANTTAPVSGATFIWGLNYYAHNTPAATAMTAI